ncbi:MAG: saccharopine dehydrogenase C-terminal domain-containing protein [Kiritimatiellae bacterium]|nr:saccharopine dehydrogenase C-terminal domain-containing protein [Kiritimatiellia bacterium]
MKILVMGLGMQGRAALHYLAASREVAEVIVADNNPVQAKMYIKKYGNRKVRFAVMDAQNRKALTGLMASGVDAVVDLLPACFAEPVARAAVEAGVHLVNTFYANDAIQQLGKEAARKGVAILPEFGFDPGMDLVIGAQALSELDEVHEFYSYGSGFPEPKASANPLRYKITWTFDGVLKSYYRQAHVLKAGREVVIPADEMFAPANIHTVNVAFLGELEAFPNGNALKYKELFGLGASLQNMGRFVMRWPGHCAFWKKMVDLHFMDEKLLQIGSLRIAPRTFLCKLLEPQLRYAKTERDVAYIRVDVRGLKNGRRTRVIYELFDYRDLATGLMAMNRAVGYTACIGAKMIVRGDIAGRGVLSPARDVNFLVFRDEIKKCGMRIRRKESFWKGK